MSLPRAIDTDKFSEARAKEILTLQSYLKITDGITHGIKSLPRSLRRRARSHASYRHLKRPNKKKRLQNQTTGQDVQAGWMNRRMRRRKEFREYLNPFLYRASGIEKSFKLSTHVWHAKRMKMCDYTRWNWVLPEGLSGKGNGTRSFMHKLKNSCILHDASYWCSVELEGPVDEMLSLLSLITVTGSRDFKKCLAKKKNPVLLKEYAVVFSEAQGQMRQLGPGSVIFLPKDGEAGSRNACIMWVHCGFYSTFIGILQKKIAEMKKKITISIGEFGRLELRGPQTKNVFERIRRSKREEDANECIENINRSKNRQVHFEVVHASDKLTCMRENDYRMKNSKQNALSFVIQNLTEMIELRKSKDDQDDIVPLKLMIITISDGMSICISRNYYNHLFRILACSGTHTVGQREWHWYHTLKRKAFYPFDYPESANYSSLLNDLVGANKIDKDMKNIVCNFQKVFPFNEDYIHTAPKRAMKMIYLWTVNGGRILAGNIVCSTLADSVQPSTLKDVMMVGIVTSSKVCHSNSKSAAIGFVRRSWVDALKSQNHLPRRKLWLYALPSEIFSPVQVFITSD